MGSLRSLRYSPREETIDSGEVKQTAFPCEFVQVYNLPSFTIKTEEAEVWFYAEPMEKPKSKIQKLLSKIALVKKDEMFSIRADVAIKEHTYEETALSLILKIPPLTKDMAKNRLSSWKNDLLYRGPNDWRQYIHFYQDWSLVSTSLRNCWRPEDIKKLFP